MPILYIVGSLRNPQVPKVAAYLRTLGHDVFDDWYSAGPEADDCWQAYEQARGHSLPQALEGYHAWHVFEFDRYHLNRCQAGVLVLPVGKSGHLELGYLMGQGKPGYILLDKEPERFDVMYRFARGVYTNLRELGEAL
jgi:hypothetical protein